MNDLVPLKILARSELEASLLRSADADEAPPQAMKRVAATLGVSASLVTLSSTAGAASAAGVAGAAGLVKSLLVGLGAGVLVSGALVTASVMTEPSPAPRPARDGPAVEADTHRPLREALRPLAPATPAPSTTQPNVSFQSRPSATPAAPRAPEFLRSSAAVTAAPGPGATSSIAEEVAELDRARALVAAGKANDALRVVDGYALRWPDGVLALEASVVRVEVELARGNKAAAERHARALIAAHPNTGHARKVASLLERANEE